MWECVSWVEVGPTREPRTLWPRVGRRTRNTGGKETVRRRDRDEEVDSNRPVEEDLRKGPSSGAWDVHVGRRVVCGYGREVPLSSGTGPVSSSGSCTHSVTSGVS